ncbi:MAG: S1C family serine protease [Acidimicrobiales bacterium]|jgi:S1-C subfamily serine protease|nr:S1C family serine protease [Acidimicrobiales bacterium]
MSPEDEPEDADGFQPPLPAEDRLWRHPSELGSPAVASPAPTTRTGRRRPRAALVASGLVVVLGALAAAGALATSGSPGTTTGVAASPRDEAIAALGPAVARLDARRDGVPTTATAVVYRADGHLLTAAEAVEEVTDPTVTLADGRVLPATVVGADPVSGIAVVRVEATDLVPAPLQTDEPVEAGAPALAVAHRPDDVESPASGQGRITGTGWKVGSGDAARHDLIRTVLGTPADTSGALLCDETGAVLGVFLPEGDVTPASTDPSGDPPTTTRVTSTDEHFAVPIAMAVRAADDLVTTGRARYGWLGLSGTDLGVAAEAPGPAGTRVTAVSPGGPADVAGLRPGDVVTTVDGAAVRSMSELASTIRHHRPGDTVTITVRRDGEDLRVAVVLSDRP